MNRAARRKEGAPSRIDYGLLEEASTVASFAIKEAGEYLLRQRFHPEVVGEKSVRDPVLLQDLNSEKLLVARIEEVFPGHSILSEEAATVERNSPYRWVVDPLDGSFNYNKGLYAFGIMLGLLLDETAILSAIYLPVFGQLYLAKLGRGATKNGSPISVSSRNVLKGSLVHFGDFAKDDEFLHTNERVIDSSRLSCSGAELRMIGSAAIDAAWVASGQGDAWIVRNPEKWDIACGGLLVTEAGGKARAYSNQPGEELYIMSNVALRAPLRDLLTSRD